MALNDLCAFKHLFNGDISFSACVPKLWNQLPDNIRAAGSVAIFKRQLKTHLFKDVYII